VSTSEGSEYCEKLKIETMMRTNERIAPRGINYKQNLGDPFFEVI
jgi:hypothetical protein